MNATQFATDIPRSAAYAAHQGTSFSPERRAEQEQEGYAEGLASTYAELKALAEKNGTLDLLDEQFERYRAGLKKYTLAYLHSRSGIVSTMIAGPSNFPVRQMEKRNNAAHNHLQRLIDFRERAQKAIRKTLCPSLRPIMSGDRDAVERLREQIDTAEKQQTLMKAANAAIRKNPKTAPEVKIAAMVAAGIPVPMAAELLKPDCMGCIGFPHYKLTNNNANIRRMKQRLARISAAKEQPHAEINGENATVEDSPADNRVRLFFPGKPAADVRAKLKSSGFRWAPSLGCWQAYRHNHTIELAKQLAG